MAVVPRTPGLTDGQHSELNEGPVRSEGTAIITQQSHVSINSPRLFGGPMTPMGPVNIANDLQMTDAIRNLHIDKEQAKNTDINLPATYLGTPISMNSARN